MLLTGNNSNGIFHVKLALDNNFTSKDLSLTRCFLGLEITRYITGTILNQSKHILDVLTDCNLMACKPSESRMPYDIKLSSDSGKPLANPKQYERFLCRLF